MFEVDDEPIETLHIYVVREEVKPPLLPIFLSVVALSLLVAFGVLSPNQQPVTRTTLRVPAVLSSLSTFTAFAPAIPTGVKTYPATTAHGILTITNGSVIAQTLPADFIIITNSGISIATDIAVFVPSGNANGYGYATVSAHALISGTSGNIPALAIDTVEGSSIYVRNLTAFHNGRNTYSVTYVTAHDIQRAVSTAHHLLEAETTGLHYPCTERINSAVIVTWRCQFLTYYLPPYMHVTGVKIIGKNLLLSVWFVARPVHIWVK